MNEYERIDKIIKSIGMDALLDYLDKNYFIELEQSLMKLNYTFETQENENVDT